MIPPHRGVVGEAFLIYDDIFRNPNSSFKELHSRNLAWREGTLRNCIQQLLDEGVIERSNPGGHGSEARYSIARPP
jgi:predicted transcriptional regulator